MDNKVSAEVVMLPSNKPIELNQIGYLNAYGYLGVCTINDDKSLCRGQHLYIVTDDKIEEGDYIYYKNSTYNSEYVYQMEKSNTSSAYQTVNDPSLKPKYRKVVASSDAELGLPIIGLDFLNDYCKEKGIDKVLLEKNRNHLPLFLNYFLNGYEVCAWNPLNNKNRRIQTEGELKFYYVQLYWEMCVVINGVDLFEKDLDTGYVVNKDNTIVLHEAVYTFNRKELIDLLNESYMLGCDEAGYDLTGIGHKPETFSDFIKEKNI